MSINPPDRSEAVNKRFPKRGKLTQNGATLGVVLSGGGWRAMESGAYFMDVLRQQGLLKMTNIVAGLSGGSWTCVLGAVTGDANRLYDDSQVGTNAWVEGGDPLTESMKRQLERVLDRDNAVAARRESLAHGGTRRGLDKDACVAAVKLMDAHLANLADAMSLNADETYLYNYSTTLGYQFYGEGYETVPLKQSTVEALPLFVVAAISPAPRDVRLDYDQHYWFEIDGVQEGGIRKMEEGEQRFLLNSMLLRFSNFNTRNVVFNSRASHVMAMCGCALGDKERSMVKGFFDKDGFSAHAFHSNDGSKEYATLFDAGISCNIPVHLTHGRCHVAFVVDASAGEVAAEEVASAVKKGYYHIYYPPGPARDSFIADHVTSAWPPGDDIRIFFPDKKHSKSLWGDTSAACERDEPILIFMRALRTESTFRMDRTRAEIDAAYATMSEVGRRAVEALEFLMEQDTVPSKAFWNTDDIFGDKKASIVIPPPPAAAAAEDSVAVASQAEFVATQAQIHAQAAPTMFAAVPPTMIVHDDIETTTHVEHGHVTSQSMRHEHADMMSRDVSSLAASQRAHELPIFRTIVPLASYVATGVSTGSAATVGEEEEDRVAPRQVIQRCQRQIDHAHSQILSIRERSELEASSIEREVTERLASLRASTSAREPRHPLEEGRESLMASLDESRSRRIHERLQEATLIRQEAEAATRHHLSIIENNTARLDRLEATMVASMRRSTTYNEDDDDSVTMISRHQTDEFFRTSADRPVQAWTALPNLFVMESAIERAFVKTLADAGILATVGSLRSEALRVLEGAVVARTVSPTTNSAIADEVVYQAYAWSITAGYLVDDATDTAQLAASMSGRSNEEVAGAMLATEIVWPTDASDEDEVGFFSVVAMYLPHLNIANAAKHILAGIIIDRLQLRATPPNALPENKQQLLAVLQQI